MVTVCGSDQDAQKTRTERLRCYPTSSPKKMGCSTGIRGKALSLDGSDKANVGTRKPKIYTSGEKQQLEELEGLEDRKLYLRHYHVPHTFFFRVLSTCLQ